ncbi:MAG: shikimate dehydrogenase, partial [Rhodoluna sp.]
MIEKYLSVVGDPIEHSLSPLIHQVAYEYLGLEWQYD